MTSQRRVQNKKGNFTNKRRRKEDPEHKFHKRTKPKERIQGGGGDYWARWWGGGGRVGGKFSKVRHEES